MNRVGLRRALRQRFFPESGPAMGRTVLPRGNEKVIVPRKHRWTVIGTALLALLVLAALAWFPPT